MSLDPRIGAFLAGLPDRPAPATLEAIRAATDTGLRQLHGPREDAAWVRSYTVPGHLHQPIQVRAYAPAGAGQARALPAIVYAHGGGWCLGSLDLYDNPCVALANATQCVVLSVGYRLAPEHKFPVPLEDFYGALCWVSKHAGELGLDRRRIAVAGDSAGGNLAAAAALLARERSGPPIAHQLLLYPALDCDFSSASYQAFAEGYWLTRETMQFCWSSYLRSDADAASAYASPLRARLSPDLPAATILVCEFDPLRDEGEAYAQKLREAGVAVRCEQLDGMVHGCIHMLGLTPNARRLFERAGAALRGPAPAAAGRQS